MSEIKRPVRCKGEEYDESWGPRIVDADGDTILSVSTWNMSDENAQALAEEIVAALNAQPDAGGYRVHGRTIKRPMRYDNNYHGEFIVDAEGVPVREDDILEILNAAPDAGDVEALDDDGPWVDTQDLSLLLDMWAGVTPEKDLCGLRATQLAGRVERLVDARESALAAQVAQMREALERLDNAASNYVQETDCDAVHGDHGMDGHAVRTLTFREELYEECDRARAALDLPKTAAEERVQAVIDAAREVHSADLARALHIVECDACKDDKDCDEHQDLVAAYIDAQDKERAALRALDGKEAP